MKTWFYLDQIMVLVTLTSPLRVRAQSPAEWHDDLVDHMAGTWKLQGQVMGHDAHHEIEAEWVLNHQFLRIHEKTEAGAPGSEKRYESLWFLGYDPVSERYLLHLLGVFGGRFSETLGYGARDGNAIRFVFEYPDGPFHTVFQWSPEKDTWRWLMTQKDKDGKWATFGDFQLTRRPKNLSAIISGAKSRGMLQPEAARTPSGATACTRPAFGDIKIAVRSWSSSLGQTVVKPLVRGELEMAYVIAEPCIGTKDTACVDVCPVDCIHPRKDEADFEAETQLYISPVECIDCGACVPVCPVTAIFALEDLPEKWANFTPINADWYTNKKA